MCSKSTISNILYTEINTYNLGTFSNNKIEAFFYPSKNKCRIKCTRDLYVQERKKTTKNLKIMHRIRIFHRYQNLFVEWIYFMKKDFGIFNEKRKTTNQEFKEFQIFFRCKKKQSCVYFISTNMQAIENQVIIVKSWFKL